MKKITLELDELRVESFEVDGDREGLGTVYANAGCVTASCGGTCGADLSTAEKFGPSQTNCPECCI